MMRVSSLLLTTVSCLVLSASHVMAGIDPVDDTSVYPAGVTVIGMSADGTIVTGNGNNNDGDQQPFIWSLGSGFTQLGYPSTIHYAQANGISRDGQVVVGQSYTSPGIAEAIRWVGGTPQALGFISTGNSSSATGTNNDGSVVVGNSNNADIFAHEAFRWDAVNGMVGLGYIPGGGTESYAQGVSGDGNVVVGRGDTGDGLHTEAWKWDAVNGMVGLGYLAAPAAAYYSEAAATNSDGSIIIGYADNGSAYEAFRWDAVNGMVGLGFLREFIWGGWQDGNRSYAYAMTDDGNVIVGESNTPSHFEAFVWTSGTGMKSLSEILAARGVDLTNWTLDSATGVDSTGNIVSGIGTLNGALMSFIANTATGGVTTPIDLADGLAAGVIPVEHTRGAVNSSVGQSLFASTQILTHTIINPLQSSRLQAQEMQIDMSNPSAINPAAGDDMDLSETFRRLWSAYAVGTFGRGHDNDMDNHSINGTTGLTVQLNKNTAIGLGIIGSDGEFDLPYNGNSSLKSMGASLVSAYEGDDGLRLYGTAFAAHLNLNNDRHYLNGASIDESNGETNGMGYGLAVRGGWEFDATDKIAVMPYLELQATHTHLNAYTEENGGFPASFGAVSSNTATSSLGAQISYAYSPTLSLGGRAAWAHRLHEDKDGLDVSSAGFTGTLSGTESDKDWMEGALSTSWQMTPATHLGAELSGRTGRTREPMGALSLSVITRF